MPNKPIFISIGRFCFVFAISRRQDRVPVSPPLGKRRCHEVTEEIVNKA